MKNLVYFSIFLSACGFAFGEDKEVSWGTSKKILKSYFETVAKEGDGIKLQAPQFGEKFFYSFGKREPKLIEYGEEVHVPAGSVLKISARHTNAEINVEKSAEKVVILVQQKVDQSSFGGGVAIAYAVSSFAKDGTEQELDKSKGAALLKGKKVFEDDSSSAPQSAPPK